MNKNVLYIFRLALTLFVITAVVAAALAGINSVTAPRIEAIKNQKLQDAIGQVLPGGGEEMEPGTYDSQGGLVTAVYASDAGFAVQVVPMGFGGEITMMVGFTPDGKVTAIQVVSHTETAGLGDVAASSGEAGQAFRAEFVGADAALKVAKDGGTVDQISGATITSRGVTDGVNAALACVAGLM